MQRYKEAIQPTNPYKACTDLELGGRRLIFGGKAVTKMKDFSGYRPSTIEEAVDILYGCLEEEDIKIIKGKDPDGFASEQHFALGLEIRNAWIYCEDSRLQPDLHNLERIDPVYMLPDLLSEEILKRLSRRVKGDAGSSRPSM